MNDSLWFNEENIAWLNSLNDGARYTEIAGFLCDFHTGSNVSGTLKPDNEYKYYPWWLAKNEDGGWDIVT